MDNPSSQLDSYTPPNDYQIFYVSYKSIQKPNLFGAIFLVYHVYFDISSFMSIQNSHSTITTKI